jgi:GT2 family glycosyltransferase
MSDMDKIAIIIVHYNTDKDTKEVLESLSTLEAKSFEHRVFVVDNASKEPLVLPRQFKNVQLVRSDTNLGFTGGNNLGFATASKTYNPDYFLLLNSDTLVASDFLEKLYQHLKKQPDLGLVVPKIYFAPGCEYHHQSYKKAELGRVIWFVGGIIDWENLLSFHLGVDEVDRGQFDGGTLDLPQFQFVSGCCFLVRREVLAATGVFNDRFFLYYEDADLSLRIKKAGFQLGYEPESVIWHKNGGSTEGSGSELQNFYLTRNRLLFFMIHGHFLTRLRTLRLAWRLWWRGNRVEKLAARNFFLRRFGKQLAI